MVSSKRRGTSKRRSSALPRHFYLNGELVRRLFISRPDDIIVVYNYAQEKEITYSYAQTKRAYRPAFSVLQVCKLLNRSKRTLKGLIFEGHIPTPQSAHSLSPDRSPDHWKYLLSEQDVINMWEYLRTVHQGRPRKDGRVTPLPLPTLGELKAMMRNEDILYAKTDEGEFVPTWKANI